MATITGMTAAEILKITVQPGTYAGAAVTTAVISFGHGAPNNANGNNGDIYARDDGGAMTTIYQKRAGAWVGIV